MKHREWFDSFLTRLRKHAIGRPHDEACYTCPCCGYPTLAERGAFRVCVLCAWEDDGQDDPQADKVQGGPNADYSLAEARANFAEYYTMYRPSDKVAFQHGQRKLAAKRELVDTYRAIQITTDQNQISQLWNKAQTMRENLKSP